MANLGLAALLVSIIAGLARDTSGDTIRTYQAMVEPDPLDALAHFRLGELFFDQRNFQSSANEFHEALNGDLHPKWIDVWAHIDLGELFDITGQRDRGAVEYRLALRTKDNTEGAQQLATMRLSEQGKREKALLHHVQAEYVRSPKPIVKSAPRYSQEARAAELEGTVMLTATIAVDGSVREVAVDTPSGLGLDEEAAAAAKRWSFEPAATQHGPTEVTTNISVNFLLPSKRSRWHLLGASFTTPEGESRPHFSKSDYPLGDGVGPAAKEEARLTAAMGRQALVILSFAIDQSGQPVKFRIETATEAVWGAEAISFVRRWRLSPGTRDGYPVEVPCKLFLAWGDKPFTDHSLLRASQESDVSSKFRPTISDGYYRRQARLSGQSVLILVRLFDGTADAAREPRVTMPTLRLPHPTCDRESSFVAFGPRHDRLSTPYKHSVTMMRSIATGLRILRWKRL
jgi:TonB family protein